MAAETARSFIDNAQTQEMLVHEGTRYKQACVAHHRIQQLPPANREAVEDVVRLFSTRSRSRLRGILHSHYRRPSLVDTNFFITVGIANILVALYALQLLFVRIEVEVLAVRMRYSVTGDPREDDKKGEAGATKGEQNSAPSSSTTAPPPTTSLSAPTVQLEIDTELACVLRNIWLPLRLLYGKGGCLYMTHTLTLDSFGRVVKRVDRLHNIVVFPLLARLLLGLITPLAASIVRV